MSKARLAGAAATLVVAAAHVPITGEHLHEAPYVGALFIALEASCLVLAVLLLRGDGRRAWLTAATLATGAIGAFVASRTVGLPQLGDDVGNWGDPLGIVALASESLLVLLSTAALLGSARGRRTVGAGTPGGGAGHLGRPAGQPARHRGRRGPTDPARAAG